MKNSISNFVIIVFSLFIAACAEDKGNYDYTMINDLQISGLPSDTSFAKLKTLVLKPEFKRSQENTEEGLTYSWEFAGKEISITRDLNYVIPFSMQAGKCDCRYVVTDTKTGMKFFKNFDLNIVSEFSWGYYFLCEGDNKQSVLSYWNIAKGTTKCLHTMQIGDYDLGREPKNLSGKFEWIASLGNYYYSMTIISADSEYPVIVTDNGSFMPQKLITTSNCVYQEVPFEPSEVINGDKNQYYVTQNKVCLYANNLVYRPAIHDKEYKWSNIAMTYYNDYLVYAYDEITQKYYVLKRQLNDPINGLVRDNYALDRVVEIKNQPDYSGKSVIGKFPSSSGIKVLITESTGVRLIDITYTDYNEDGKCTSSALLPIEGGVSNNAVALLNGNNWYVATNNKIYISPTLLPKFEEWVILPPELGGITAISPSGYGRKIIATMYNSNAAATKKGSFVIIDLITKAYEVRSNLIDKCISIGAFNSDPYGQGFGDGQ